MSQTVMLIDDSSSLRKMVGRALIAAGFQVVEACDGVDAIEKLATAGAIGLIVCDVNMPRMSGIEFVEALAKRDSPPPVLMLTTESNPELIQRAQLSGVSRWLFKPFMPDQLVAAARELAGV